MKNNNKLRKLIFVYNAKSGIMHGVVDLIHKTAKPSTYPCKLCAVTFSGATMNKIWKQYVSTLGMATVFLHRNEFEESYPGQKVNYPVILEYSNENIKVLISDKEFEKISGLPDLITTLKSKL